jgi:hypothetical protein
MAKDQEKVSLVTELQKTDLIWFLSFLKSQVFFVKFMIHFGVNLKCSWYGIGFELL